MDPCATTRSPCGLDLPWRGNSWRGSRTSSVRQEAGASTAYGLACRLIKWALTRSTASGAKPARRAKHGPPLLRGQRQIGAHRANALPQLIELAGVIGGSVGRYDLDVPA